MIRSFIYFTVVFFCLCLIIPIVFMFFSDFNDAIQGIDEMPTVAKDSLTDQVSSFDTVWDYTLLTVLFAVVAGILGIVWILPTQPVVVFATMLVVTIVGAVSGYLANAWITITNGSDAYSAAITSFPIINFIISNYLYFVIGLGFLILIVFYAKPNPEGAF